MDSILRAAAPGALREGASGDGKTLHGHFAVTNVWTEINSVWEGRFMERFAPGAFLPTMARDRARMRVLFQHGRDFGVGSRPIASIFTLREDEIGAYYEASMLDGVPELVLSGLRAGLYGASFRFSVQQEELIKEPEPSEYNPKGLPERTVTEVGRLVEFGPVTFGAYSEATSGVRSLTDWYYDNDRAAA